MDDIQSSNINSLWLQNIYENLKKIEEYERYAREGCSSIFEYLQYPIETRRIILADVQYKNLKLILNEMLLVIPDLAPVIREEQTEQLKSKFNRIRSPVNNRTLMIKESYSESKRSIINSEVTENFGLALDALSLLRQEIIMLIKDLLYVKMERNKTW